MFLPEDLVIVDEYTLKLPSGSNISVPLSQPIFDSWKGTQPEDTYGGKSVLEYNGEPVFAEILILRKLQEAGWDGVWVDTFRGKFLNSYYPNREEVEIPENCLQLLNKIENKIGTKSGCFDIYCWKGNEVLFAEAKRQSKDRIRKSQKKWIEGALATGISRKSLLIVEWSSNSAV
ncbi:MAG TPA: hypothetical protein VJ937_12950 [Salinivirga sp.]|uniref:hypothetical protein n=1 Tax=Salinivirga sp. TaxID=1970192 RepID=UPI002B4A385A|nr:hypothetical protein [Salinivirga sp.]HKK60381.1 hypothetical protein [Salinivirga sp.]